MSSQDSLKNQENNQSIDIPATSDIETNRYQADVVGEEAVGGTTPTPEQNDVDELGQAAGVEFADNELLAVKDKIDRRDENRWELDMDANQ